MGNVTHLSATEVLFESLPFRQLAIYDASVERAPGPGTLCRGQKGSALAAMPLSTQGLGNRTSPLLGPNPCSFSVLVQTLRAAFWSLATLPQAGSREKFDRNLVCPALQNNCPHLSGWIPLSTPKINLHCILEMKIPLVSLEKERPPSLCTSYHLTPPTEDYTNVSYVSIFF